MRKRGEKREKKIGKNRATSGRRVFDLSSGRVPRAARGGAIARCATSRSNFDFHQRV